MFVYADAQRTGLGDVVEFYNVKPGTKAKLIIKS